MHSLHCNYEWFYLRAWKLWLLVMLDTKCRTMLIWCLDVYYHRNTKSSDQVIFIHEYVNFMTVYTAAVTRVHVYLAKKMLCTRASKSTFKTALHGTNIWQPYCTHIALICHPFRDCLNSEHTHRIWCDPARLKFILTLMKNIHEQSVHHKECKCQTSSVILIGCSGRSSRLANKQVSKVIACTPYFD